MTNLEKIRKMSADEMAEFLQTIAYCGSDSCEECAARFICKTSNNLLEIVEVLNMEVNE